MPETHTHRRKTWPIHVGMRVKKNVVNVNACIRVLKVYMPDKYGDKVAVGVEAQSLADVAAIMMGKDGSED